MNDQQIRDEFRKAVIMANHKCQSFEEALNLTTSPSFYRNGRFYLNKLDREVEISESEALKWECLASPITIGKIMAAMKNSHAHYGNWEYMAFHLGSSDWTLLKKDCSEATVADQSIETITILHNYLIPIIT